MQYQAKMAGQSLRIFHLESIMSGRQRFRMDMKATALTLRL